MPVPKRKTSKSRRDSSHANKGIKAKNFSQCSNCQEALVPHQVCAGCGFYKGAKVMITKLDRKVKRLQARKKVASRAQASESTDQQ